MTATMLYIPVIYKQGQPVLRDRSDKLLIEKLAHQEEGNPGIMTLKVGEMSRSLRQNAFYRSAVIKGFINLTGTANPEYWHSHLTNMFLKERTADGKEYVRSTADLTMREMHDYIQSCMDFLADEGGSIPELDFAEWERM